MGQSGFGFAAAARGLVMRAGINRIDACAGRIEVVPHSGVNLGELAHGHPAQCDAALIRHDNQTPTVLLELADSGDGAGEKFEVLDARDVLALRGLDRKSTRLNSS